ncbi:response regulator [Clostridiaceae bacterium]|nr:response regulator [Clostridiaceae bacterium]NBI81987.1 response regulator [Clostridiaceae bacterium]
MQGEGKNFYYKEKKGMKLTVLVVDADPTSRDPLVKALRASSKIEQVYQADRLDAAYVFAKSADLMLLNPLVPNGDGVTFLERLIAQGIRPGVFIFSAFYTQELMQEYLRLGVACCMMKPVDINLLLRKIEEWQNISRKGIGERKLEIRARISKILMELGMSPISGYYDCCTAVEWLCCNRNARGRITKELYPYLAHATGQSTNCVERNIRYVIGRTWARADETVLTQYFGDATARSSRPSNAAFLCAIAEHLRHSTNLFEDELC